MDAKSDCVLKKVCFCWNGIGANSKCVEDCIHYTVEALKPSHNPQSLAMPRSCKECVWCSQCKHDYNNRECRYLLSAARAGI